MVHLNSKEHDLAICYLTSTNLKECGACGLTLDELKADDNEKRRKKYGKICECDWYFEGKPKNEPKYCPKCKGHRRLRPLLIVEHEFGTGTDKEMRWGCMSCNRVMAHVEQEIHLGEREMTREKQDFMDGRPALINFIGDRIKSNDEGHVCQDSILYAPITDSKKSYSIITKKRWLKDFIWTEQNQERGKFEVFEYGCSSALCNGQHIAFHGLIPRDIMETLKAIDEINQTNKYYKNK